MAEIVKMHSWPYVSVEEIAPTKYVARWRMTTYPMDAFEPGPLRSLGVNVNGTVAESVGMSAAASFLIDRGGDVEMQGDGSALVSEGVLPSYRTQPMPDVGRGSPVTWLSLRLDPGARGPSATTLTAMFLGDVGAALGIFEEVALDLHVWYWRTNRGTDVSLGLDRIGREILKPGGAAVSVAAVVGATLFAVLMLRGSE